MKNIIMDVDTGIDDAIAIIMAAKSRDLNLLGITTVTGNVSAKQSAINSMKVLKFIDEANIPVICGSEVSYIGGCVQNNFVHGKDGIFEALNHVEVSDFDVDAGGAMDFLINTIMEKKEEGVTLILTAPLTNLALAITEAPYIAKFINEAIIMGGANKCSGNITPFAEFNFFKDPEAANIVLNSGIPITLITLDVTNKVILTDEDIEKIVDPAIKDFIQKITITWMDRYEKRFGLRGCLMHDPLTVAYLIDKSFIETDRYRLSIITGDGINKGQIICVENNLSQVEVSIGVKEKDFKEIFLKVINI